MKTRQSGAASLLMALVLMLSMTLVTLSTARTHLTETRMAGNEHRHYRLHLQAESAWENATRQLADETRQLVWTTEAETGSLVSRLPAPAGDETVETRVLARRTGRDNPLIEVHASAALPGNGNQKVGVSQWVRLLSVLSPMAESAPPLVLNGCLSPASAVDIRPLNSDSSEAGDAMWQFGTVACPPTARLDSHTGHSVAKTPAEDLWGVLFSVNREEYAQLAASDQALPLSQRHYWLGESNSTQAPVWRTSIGSAAQPVVLVFPATAGCPRFAAGVRIVGVVFIDAACPEPLTDAGLEITGTLIVNGTLDAGSSRLRLKHIQVDDPAQMRLELPILRLVKVPGSWRDY